MPGESTGIDTTGGTTEGILPIVPRITADYYITQSFPVRPPESTETLSAKNYVNVIVTLTQVEIEDFSTVWDNLKSNITANTTAMTS